jgi:guanosine-diphosphatase
VYQPSLLDSFPSGRVFLLSYFYDRIYPLLPPSKISAPPTTTYPTELTVSTIASLARNVCQGHSAWTSNLEYPHWASTAAVLEELEGRPEYCLDLTFMYALLRMGYEFDDGRQVRIEKKVAGTELGWCLGATIELVGDGKLTCNDDEED